MKELLKKFKKGPLPNGNSLCYKGEKDGHGQVDLEVTPTDQEIVLFPSPFNSPEIVRRQSGK